MRLSLTHVTFLEGEMVWLNRLMYFFNQTPLFFLLLVIVRLPFKDGVYPVPIVQLLFKGGDYARAASIRILCNWCRSQAMATFQSLICLQYASMHCLVCVLMMWSDWGWSL